MKLQEPKIFVTPVYAHRLLKMIYRREGFGKSTAIVEGMYSNE